MGKVFTWAEIEQGRVPALESFDVVGKMLQKSLKSSKSIVGAQIVGSFLRGDHWVGSDIDVVVVYDLAVRTSAMRLLQVLRRKAADLFVPVEFISVDTNFAETRHHHIATTFLDHFRLCSRFGGVIKKGPSDIIIQNRDSILSDTYSYVVHKMRTFEKGQSSLGSLSEEQRVHLLEKALSFPVYLARKMLRSIGHEFIGNDSSSEVATLYRKLIQVDSDAFLEMNEINTAYRDIVQFQLLHPNGPEYERALKRLETVVPLAYGFARENLVYLTRRFPA